MLLPWRVNGTLDPAEAALFDAHLAECAECQADLAAERSLCGALASMPTPELDGRPLPVTRSTDPRQRPAVRRRFLARRIPLGWALAGQATAAAAVALFLLLPTSRATLDADYRLLGSQETAAAGNVIVMFAPDTTDSELRAALGQVGGRIVDGPTASGAYIVRVASAERPAAIERLRSAAAVILAEPIDEPGRP